MSYDSPVVLEKWYKNCKNFFVPNKQNTQKSADVSAFCVAVIPTLNPTDAIYELITSLLQDPLRIHVVIVDDGSDPNGESKNILNHLMELDQRCDRAHFVQPGKNLRKPGAINYGLSYVAKIYADSLPDIVFTCDDDVRIDDQTVQLLVNGLHKSSTIAAASTTAKVSNKNANLLSRLQALEYHGFSLNKVADNGFYHGPLVMQGMFTAFKYQAIKEVQGFSEHNLIEDYDITARMKKWGWNVIIVPQASAWTDVPLSISQLWRQRVRWTYWGLHVVRTQGNYLAAVIQDVIGHITFLAMTLLIAASFIITPTHTDSNVVFSIVILALSQFVIGMIFQIITLKEYKDADVWDWILRLSLIPETLYSVMLSTIMLGSYVFYIYTTLVNSIAAKSQKLSVVYVSGLRIFELFGYTAKWGTRTSNS